MANLSTLQEVRYRLGPGAYEDDSVIIYQGDCIDLMSQLGSPVASLVVTSPPYNIGKAYEMPLTMPEYVEWCGNWMKLIHAITVDDGQFWLNLGYAEVPSKGRAVPLPYLLWDKSPFHLVQEIVWNYGAGVAARRSFSPRNEKFLWYVKDPGSYCFNLDAVRDPNVKYPNQKKNGKLKCNTLGKNPTDVWQFPKVTSGKNRSSVERTPHPAQFPAAVIERIILACSRPGDLIVDPFMGSGTVADVGRRLARTVVGFELKSEYVEIAANRLQTPVAEQRPLL